MCKYKFSFWQQKPVLNVWTVISLTTDGGFVDLWTTSWSDKSSFWVKTCGELVSVRALYPSNLGFQICSYRDGVLCADRERFVWFVHFTITTFHLHAFFYTCLCLPPSSFSLLWKHLLIFTLFPLGGFPFFANENTSATLFLHPKISQNYKRFFTLLVLGP